MQNMNRLYRTFDLWVSPLYLLLSLLEGFIVIFPRKNIRRWCDGERREKRREKREGNVIPPLSPPLSPHTATVMVRDVYTTLQLGRYI